jgi:UDP-2-acetamido-3-amino-2,3-dideoxy-glucuronate N-acetyltransferase
MKKTVAVIGCGYWGKNIVRNLNELRALHSICDTNPEILNLCKDNYPKINIIPKLNDIINTDEVKAVAIATPAVTHYEIAKKALLAGKDVFVEKPLALRFEEGKELVDLAKKKNKILMVGHILQYHPAVTKLKELIDKGRLGKIQYIYSNRLNIGKLRLEENILWSFAPHDISAVLMLLGKNPIDIKCFGADYLNKGIYDVTMTTLVFKDAVKAHIFVSWLHPFKEQKLVVVGSKAMAVFDDLSKEKLFIYPHKIKLKKGKAPIAYKAEHYCVNVKKGEPLKNELIHFIDCLAARKIPKTSGEEGLSVLRVLEEAERTMQHKSVFTETVPERTTPARDKVSPRPKSSKSYFVHPSSYIDEDVTIGRGTKVWHFSHILKNTKIGERCIVGQGVMIGPYVGIGSGCKIQNNVSVYKGYLH